MTVLQSAAEVAADAVFSVADLAVVPGAVFATAGLGFAGHTPFTVMTASSGGTAADVSGGGAGACDGGGVPGAACPQARVLNKTHTSQLLRISHFLQDWSIRKLKMPSTKS